MKHYTSKIKTCETLCHTAMLGMEMWTNHQWKHCLRNYVRTSTGKHNARIGTIAYPWQDCIVLVEQDSGEPQVQVSSADLLNSARAVQPSLPVGDASTADKITSLLQVGPGLMGLCIGSFSCHKHPPTHPPTVPKGKQRGPIRWCTSAHNPAGWSSRIPGTLSHCSTPAVCCLA